MTERGFVLDNKDNFSKIRIERNSACASCGKCGMTEKQKHVDFFVENTCNAAIGDVVELDIPDVNTAPLAFIAYILPLVPALILLLVSVFMNWPIWASVVAFFGGLIVGIAIIALIDKMHKHRWAQSPTMKAVVYKSNGKQTAQPSESVAEETADTVTDAGANSDANNSKE